VAVSRRDRTPKRATYIARWNLSDSRIVSPFVFQHGGREGVGSLDVYGTHATPIVSHRVLQAAWGNQGGDPDMFGMWMEDLGEEQNSDMDDVSELCGAAFVLMVSNITTYLPLMFFFSLSSRPKPSRSRCVTALSPPLSRPTPTTEAFSINLRLRSVLRPTRRVLHSSYSYFCFGQNESLASVSSSDRERRRRERKNIARARCRPLE